MPQPPIFNFVVDKQYPAGLWSNGAFKPADFPSGSAPCLVVFQNDGNLGIYTAGGQLVWSLDQVFPGSMNNKRAEWNGKDLVTYDAQGKETWTSDVRATAEHRLDLTYCGELRIHDLEDQLLWSSSVGRVDAPTAGDLPVRTQAGVETQLVQGLRYCSEGNPQHFLMFQPDGNLCVYNVATGQYKWGINQDGARLDPKSKAVLKSDGTFVIETNGTTIWSKGTPGGPAQLTLDAQGRLRLERSGATIWSSP